MENNNINAVVEITSKSIKFIAGYVYASNPYVLALAEEECSGLSNGLIIDEDKVMKTIEKVLSEQSSKLGVDLKEVNLVLPPFSFTYASDSGTTATVDGNNIICPIDTLNIINQMRKKTFKDSSFRIVDIIPVAYRLNNGDTFRSEPNGKYSETLTLNASIYAINNKVYESFTSIFTKLNIKIKSVGISQYLSALYLSKNKTIPEEYILIDIGEEVTSISKIQNGSTVVGCKMIRFGGKYITDTIAEAFSIESSFAKELKETLGMDYNPSFFASIYEKYTLDDLRKCIEKSLDKNIYDIKAIIDEFKREPNESLPLLIAGGSALLRNIDKYFESRLEMNVISYSIDTIGARLRGFIPLLGMLLHIKTTNKDEDNSSKLSSNVESQL